MARETWVQSQVESYQRLKKWYLMPPCLTLSIIRYGSRIKWSNPGKWETPSPTPWWSSYRKGAFELLSTNVANFTLYIHIYIYIYNSSGFVSLYTIKFKCRCNNCFGKYNCISNLKIDIIIYCSPTFGPPNIYMGKKLTNFKIVTSKNMKTLEEKKKKTSN